MSYYSGAKPANPTKMATVKVMGEVADEGAAEKKDAKKYDDWQLEDACRTLTQAEEIKADPELMTALKPHLEKKTKTYKSLAKLKQMGAAAKVST